MTRHARMLFWRWRQDTKPRAGLSSKLPPMPPLPLSLAVITHNEADIIARCLDSVPFAAEKLVVDQGSDDDTVAIARPMRRAWCIRTGWASVRSATSPPPSAATTGSWCWMPTNTSAPELADELQQRLPAADGRQRSGGLAAPQHHLHGRADALVSPVGGRAAGAAVSPRTRPLDRCAGARIAALRGRRTDAESARSTTSTTPPCRTSSSRYCAMPN